MANIFLGNQGTIYWSTFANALAPAGDYPTQAEYESWLSDAVAAGNVGDNVMDVELSLDSNMADTTTRLEARQGFATEVAVTRNSKVSFDLRWESSDAFQSELLDAWSSRQGISLAFMNQPSAPGANGLIGHFSVSMTKNEALQDIQKASFSLSAMLYPYWLVVGA